MVLVNIIVNKFVGVKHLVTDIVEKSDKSMVHSRS